MNEAKERANVVVQKYGGSSVADVERIQKVADRVAATRQAGKHVVVVVSAMGDNTDELLALARKVTDSPSRRELDMLLSAGERISMALLSMALNARGVPAVRYAHEPDTRYLYSNIGYATLGVALSRAAGQPFTEYVQQRILEPLGMKRTAFDPDAAMRPHLTKAYQIDGGKIDGEASVREHAGRGYRVPNGGLLSTVDDLARFVSWELGEGPSGILKKETQDDNYARVSSANGDLTSGYGVGFMATRRGTLVALGHGGSTAGYRAAAQFHRRSKSGVVVLASVGGGKLDVGSMAMRALEKMAALQGPPAAGQP